MSSKFKHSTRFDQTPTKFEPSHMKSKPDKKEVLPLSLSLSLSHTHIRTHMQTHIQPNQRDKNPN